MAAQSCNEGVPSHVQEALCGQPMVMHTQAGPPALRTKGAPHGLVPSSRVPLPAPCPGLVRIASRNFLNLRAVLSNCHPSIYPSFALMSWLGRRSGSVPMNASRAAVFGILLVLVTGAMSLPVVKQSTLMPSERKVPATNHTGSSKKCGVSDVYEANVIEFNSKKGLYCCVTYMNTSPPPPQMAHGVAEDAVDKRNSTVMGVVRDMVLLASCAAAFARCNNAPAAEKRDRCLACVGACTGFGVVAIVDAVLTNEFLSNLARYDPILTAALVTSACGLTAARTGSYCAKQLPRTPTLPV